MSTETGTKAMLHLVFGGDVDDPRKMEFKDTDDLDIIGIFPNYKTALAAWRGASQAHVDNAHRKYVIVHLHRLLEPEEA